MARGRATRKPPTKTTKSKIKPLTKSRRKPIRKKRVAKKNVPQLSYKDSHSIGRRKSTNVPTYSESGRLYYDLHVRYGLRGAFEIKEEKPSGFTSHNGGFESDFSDTTTVACNEYIGPSSSTKNVKVERKKKQHSIKRPRSPVKSSPSSLNSRREASLNAEAKVNMLFESTKESTNKRRSLPALPVTTVKNEESSVSCDKSSSDRQTPRRRMTKAKKTRISEPPPPPILSPPQKRLAGLNATAIISACIKSPYSNNKKPRRGRPPKSSLKPQPPQKFEEVSSSKSENVPSDPAKRSPPSLSPPPVTTTPNTTSQIQTASSTNAITTLATVSTDTKVVPASAVSTLERFQSQKVISYGPKCIGVENISRQIIHVPTQSHCVPGPSYANHVAQQQRIASHPVAPFSTPPSQNHSMIMIPDSSSFSPPQAHNLIPASADMQHHPCFTTNQYYLSPFSSTSGQHQQQPTFYMSIPSPAPQFQFFSAAPFAYMQPSAQGFMPNNSYMLPMSFSPQLYNGFPLGGGCFVPRPVFTTVSQPSPQLPPQLTPLPQTSLVSELGSPPTINQPSQSTQRMDRAASPMESSPSNSTPVKKPQSSKRNSAAVSTVTTTSVVEKEKPSPCLWEWVGEPSEMRVFLKPNSPPVMRLCYPSMRHQKDGMVVSPGDNVLLCSGPDRQGAPHVAKVTALFNDPDTGTKMMALLWYYRPESLVPPRRNGVIDCELFASRHCDVNPVDCIDDLAYVYSALPYARFMALAKYKQECRTHRRPISIVPPLHKISNDASTTSTTSKVSPSGDISEFPEEATISNVFLCRAWYDFHSRRVMRNLKTLNNNHITTTTTSIMNNNGSSTNKQQHPQPVTSSSPVGQTTRPEVSKSATIQSSTEEELSNGRAVLETTAELSINWADHGEQIAMSLGGGSLVSKTSPPRKNKTSKAGPESVSSLPLPSSSSS